ncbi:hypothetical protein OIU79_030501 [Salix purpurea]|uniref:Reverse transcriptase/retrotransposon-derived protein RNase H-like domain-containing protein n=1 Tax=Salix purpurea TaxID=77065 RepID=A0A9Q0VAR5_SALPP|nr:hypothetical protein OIU79_030501 [Salix purpurea]
MMFRQIPLANIYTRHLEIKILNIHNCFSIFILYLLGQVLYVSIYLNRIQDAQWFSKFENSGEFPGKLETVKKIQQFCGLANYARPYFKKLASYLKHIYQKTGKNGQKKFDDQDVKAIQTIKEMVKTLPPLKLPLDSDYLVIHTDGSEDGEQPWLLNQTNIAQRPKNNCADMPVASTNRNIL